MKQTITTLIAFFVLLFLYTKLVGPIPFSVTSVTTTKTDTFSVTGEGKATAIPDVATVNAGVAASGNSVQQAQQELNKRINAVSEAIKKVGIDPKDIKTANYTIFPSYDYTQGQRITGYQANTNLTITVRTIDKANSVIDAATANGANVIGGMTFDVSDKTKALNQAREQAVAEAKKRAEDASRIAGFKLGRVINYAENLGGEPRPVPMMAKVDVAGGGVPTQVEPGSTEIRVSVTLSFEIR